MTYDPKELRGEVPFFRVMIDEDFISDCVLRDDHIALVEAKDATIARLTAELEAAKPVAKQADGDFALADAGRATPAEAEPVAQLIETAQWARNRLEAIADEGWHGDARDFKRSLIGVFADFDAALAACGSSIPAELLTVSSPPAAPTVQDAARYRWLRSRNLDAIHAGGVFAGMTPENVVLNGDDLDAAIDRAMAAIQKGASHG